MASSTQPRSSSSFWFFTLLAAPPPVRVADGFQSARHEDSNKGILDILRNGETRHKYSPMCFRRGGRRHLNSSSAVPCLPSFILDSGATWHVAGDKSWFTAAPPACSAAAYRTRDGSALTVAGVGTISWDNFDIPNVLYVPDLRTGSILVSVQQLAERDYTVMFGGGQCCVKDGNSGEIVGRGRLHDDNGLYHLDFLQIPSHPTAA